MKAKTYFARCFLVVVLLSLFTMPVMAMGLAQTPVPNGDPVSFSDLVIQWGSLAGAGALIAVLINILKNYGVVKDGQAITWSTILNLIGMAALLLLRIFRPDVDVTALDGVAEQISQVLFIVIGLITQLASAKGTHAVIKGTPVIGKSFTLERAALENG